MNLNLNGAPWREKRDEVTNFVSQIRRTNGSIPSLDEVLRFADNLTEEAGSVGLTIEQLIFFLKHFELKDKPVYKKRKK